MRQQLESLVATLEDIVYGGPSIDGIALPIIAIALLGTGLFLTLRLGFIQIRRIGHGIAVTTGKYDDPAEPGDVPHFQALTTALSATVGIGNIAGVALAIHWGGPGALFWMWVTALFGMAVKFSEVTLAQHYRVTHEPDPNKPWQGTVSGGPMYYIERGLGPKWKPLAIFFAFALMITSFLTGNAVQANTVADVVRDNFGFPVWITGLFTATIVGAVILGGITRIGRVTSILAPFMALLYVTGAMAILAINYADILPSFALIFREAFNPTAGAAGTGAGAFLLTLMWGVRRGLFSNEAGQGSAPIAHAAAKTDEPVSEGVVALLEPLIDTLIICTMTGLVIISTGSWDDRIPTTLLIGGDQVSYRMPDERGIFTGGTPPPEIRITAGVPETQEGETRFAWHNAPVDTFYVDEAMQQPFTGMMYPGRGTAVSEDGTEYAILHGGAVRTGAPLTTLAFERGLGQMGMGPIGRYIVLLSVLLFAISTSIAWSYYGDRCAYYLWGDRAILPFKAVFVIMHFVGAVTALNAIWALGDVALGLVTFPNLIALVLLSGVLVKLTKSYFERKPWIQNAEDHKRAVAEERARKQAERDQRR